MAIRRTANTMIQSHMGEHAYAAALERLDTDLVAAVDLLTNGVDGWHATIKRADGCLWVKRAVSTTGAIEWLFKHPDVGTIGIVTYVVEKSDLTRGTLVQLVCRACLPGSHGKKPLCNTRAHGNTLEEVLHNAEFFIRVKTANDPCWHE